MRFLKSVEREEDIRGPGPWRTQGRYLQDSISIFIYKLGLLVIPPTLGLLRKLKDSTYLKWLKQYVVSSICCVVSIKYAKGPMSHKARDTHKGHCQEIIAHVKGTMCVFSRLHSS